MTWTRDGGAVRIERRGCEWFVPSQTGNGDYLVNVESAPPVCSCPDYELRGVKCKHIYAVEYVVSHEVSQTATHTTEETASGVTTTVTETTTETTTRTKRVTYRQDWPTYNAAQTHEKAHFQALLYSLCADLPELPRQPGPGRARLPLRDMVFAACFKVYSTVSCRRFMSDLDDAQAKGYLSRVPHFNSIFKYLELPAFTPVLRILIETSSLPMKAIETRFAVDSTGLIRYASGRGDEVVG